MFEFTSCIGQDAVGTGVEASASPCQALLYPRSEVSAYVIAVRVQHCHCLDALSGSGAVQRLTTAGWTAALAVELNTLPEVITLSEITKLSSPLVAIHKKFA